MTTGEVSVDISEMSVESVFSSLPAVEQAHQIKLFELFAAPGVQMKKRMRSTFSGVMDEEERNGHLEHLRKRMCVNPGDCDLTPSPIELKFDEIVNAKFVLRKQQLEDDGKLIENLIEKLSGKKIDNLTATLDAALSEGCDQSQPYSLKKEVEVDVSQDDTLMVRQQQLDKDIDELSQKTASLEATLSNVRRKLSMKPAERIMELYRKGFVDSTKQHKGNLRKFARVLAEAIFEFLPELAVEHGLDMKTLMENVSIHDFQKMMQSAAFGGDTYDKDLGATYANFKNKDDPALALFFNSVSFHGVIEGSRERGHHPHGAAALTNTPASEKLRAFLLSGTQDINKKVEAMADTLEAAFSGRILKAKAGETNSNAWLVFSEREFFPGGSQEVPVEELVMRYRILLTDASLKTLEECREATSYVAEDGAKKLMTTAMLKAISPVFARMVDVGETM